MTKHPVVVIGGGPVGLAAVAHLVNDGLEPLVLEAGDSVGARVLEWGHVQLFSPWRYNIDAVAAEFLQQHGWSPPELDALPTGSELVGEYLVPLSRVPQLQGRVLTSSRVISVTRIGADKVKHDRDKAPFLVRVRSGGTDRDVTASAVVDASGTWGRPNPLGANGVPALGEDAFASTITYGIPDVGGRERSWYAGKTTAVVGSGHSAANVVLALARLRTEEPATTVHWVVRGVSPRAFGGGAADELPARGALGTQAQDVVVDGVVELHTGFSVQRVTHDRDGLRMRLIGADGGELAGLDEIIVATGQRPDLSLTSELRVDLDLALESTRELGPLIDPNVHSCGTVRPHSYVHLAHPEPGLFSVGAKSYGRAPTFLLATGYEQVRSVSAHLAGDEERARRVSLVLPATGVCGSTAGSGCCGTPSSAQSLAATSSASSCCG